MDQKWPKMAKNGSFFGYHPKICKKSFPTGCAREIDPKMAQKMTKNGQKMVQKWTFWPKWPKMSKNGNFEKK